MIELTSGKLDRACCYLSGPMEYAADHGVEWRRKFIKMVWDRGLDIDFIDPTNKPGSADNKVGEEKGFQSTLQEQGRFSELQKYVGKYRRFDLRAVDLSDFLVCLVDPNVHMCGTYDEVFTAERQHKPTFFICEGGLRKLPRWLFDVVDLDSGKYYGKRCNVFETLEDVVNELVMLDSNAIPMSDEWVLMRKFIEQIRLQNPNRRQSN